MHDLKPTRWYAAKIAANLPPEAFQPVPTRLIGGVCYLSLVVAGILSIGLLDLPVLAMLGISLLIACGFGGLGFLAHETLHGSVVRKAWLRDSIGAIGFWQFGIGPLLWRKWHNMEHHGNTQSEHDDPDAMGTVEAWLERPVLRGLYRMAPWLRSALSFIAFLGFFSVFGLKQFVTHVQGNTRKREVVTLWVQMLAPYAFWVALLVVLGPLNWLFAYVIPVLLANFLVIAYISTNHQLNPLTDVNDPLANSLSVIVPRWVDVLHYNFSHHTEHHLFPGMNPKYAPLVRTQVRTLFPDQYHEMGWGSALAALWKTPRLYQNKTDLTDPQRALGYGSLGHGLNPKAINPRKVKVASQVTSDSAVTSD